MASQSKGFSHISVSAEDDDIVILAGAYDRGSGDDFTSDSESAAATEVKAADDIQSDAEAEEVSQAHVEDASGEAKPQGTKKPAEAQMRTSLEDLESAKMGTLQKVIVAVAAVAIVAFAVYYICFM